ncbi:hypothetical protein Aph01nite_18250 [Acrocarpospora phusangensis]|uniref:Uncharacterized protein n=1 Tax=Acrocarpospora phusangensis TaxID=1070424 RepID=A0A919QBA9_9ACTN|nr:hypothetical protein [Acrocarpospora phusangensis]GIH23515.1 hypothetical protein Aph01nite_18250 [Acrocarpospora phusangensis]
MNEFLDLDALWKVLVTSLVAGVGLATLFSLALVGLSSGRVSGRAGAGACLLLVAAGIGLGLYTMLAA